MRRPEHVASVLHGAAGTPGKSFEINGSMLQRMQHEIGRPIGGSPSQHIASAEEILVAEEGLEPPTRGL